MRKVWFVTGSSRGLGRAVVEEVLKAGHQVVATARNVDTLRDLAGAYGKQVLPQPLDVTDPRQAQDAIAAAVDHFGRLDVVVNNAGYANMAPIEEVDMADFPPQVEAVSSARCM
jgi:NAD(P)-dependent dehydrogenase (short-subunit alcohol dehydrogenase family)